MEIIILGFILFILSVSATIVYDKHKDKAIAAFKDRQARITIRQEAAKQAAVASATTPKKKSQEEILSELLRERNHNQPRIKRTIKPGSIEARWMNHNDLPQETQHMEELFDDVSINSKVTVQELIEKLERMKKKR